MADDLAAPHSHFQRLLVGVRRVGSGIVDLTLPIPKSLRGGTGRKSKLPKAVASYRTPKV